jgi:CBS domain-containing protein
MAPEILHLSSLVGSPLLDRRGDKIGRIEDLVIRGTGEAHPPVGGLVVRIGGRELFVPIELVWEIKPRSAQLQGERLNLARFERRAGELLLARDLSARHLINLVGARLIRANEIELAFADGAWRVVGVDPSSRGVIRRILPHVLGQRIALGGVVDWESIEPFVAHIPSARMRIPYRKLSKLRPAQIADLVEAASHDEGKEIIEAVGLNRELEADVFEELDQQHQIEFLEARSNDEAGRLLARMEPDDAVDLLHDLDQERRIPILEAMPAPQQAKLRHLLNYNPATAGGLMSPDFLALDEQTPVSEVLSAARISTVADEALMTVYELDGEGKLAGTVSIVRLLKANPSAKLADVAENDPVSIHADADLHEIVRKMADFNLSNLPVVDNEMRIIGVITVDDVLEEMIPSGWRRDLGITSLED